MEDSKKPNQQPLVRNTLKLKSPVAKAATPPSPMQKAKPAVAKARDPASWADAHKNRMQAEMDALSQPQAGRGDQPE